jgi:hypothetical protein
MSDIQWTESKGENFVFLHHVWSVQKAKEILRDKSVPLVIVPYELDELRQLLSVPSYDDAGVLKGMSIGVNVDWDRIRADIAKPEAEQEIKLDVPVIMAVTPQKNGIVIDGYHRIGKAVLLKLNKLPVVVLSPAESRRCKLA